MDGWDAITCAKRRNLITNNVRFLVREEHRRRNLASQSLAAALKVLPQQWQEQFGYRPLLAETFTDPELHAGTCYNASGWEALGHTKGYRRHRCDFYIPNERPKRLWIKALHPRARELLCAPQLPLECQAGQRLEGAGARSALKMKELQSLREALRSIPDPHRQTPPISTLDRTVCGRIGALRPLRAFERNCSPWPASEPSPTSSARFSNAQEWSFLPRTRLYALSRIAAAAGFRCLCESAQRLAWPASRAITQYAGFRR
jgi:hypothetical protein